MHSKYTSTDKLFKTGRGTEVENCLYYSFSKSYKNDDWDEP